MTRTKCPDEFKEQVVREILEKKRTIASMEAYSADVWSHFREAIL